MAETILATASERQIWQTKFFQEYVRDSRFMPYMSNADINQGGIILTRFETQDQAFKTINVPFIGRLKSAGVTGATVLDGFEEELTNYNMPITVDWRRNGVRVPKSTQYRTEINLLNAAKSALQVWQSEKLRDDIIRALAGFVVDVNGSVVPADAVGGSSPLTAAQANTFSANNADRLLFGLLVSNYSATWATALGNVAASAKISAAALNLMKRRAKAADPHIRPFRVDATQAREYYVCFVGARLFRDLALDTTIVTANTQARGREGTAMDKNPLFQDGDLIYNGVIVREVPEIDDYYQAIGTGQVGSMNGAGASGADLRPAFLCGGGAVGVVWGQEPTPRSDYVKDYGFRPGVAIEELLGVKKINYNGVQNGMVTGIFGAAADS